MILFHLLLWALFENSGLHDQVAHAEENSALIQTTGSLLSPELLRARDPFKMPEFVKKENKDGLTEIERFSLTSLKLVGVITGPEKFRALVAAPDGRNFSVAKNSKIGQNGGVVSQIYSNRIVVTEKTTNLLGQLETLEIDLPLAPPGQRSAK